MKPLKETFIEFLPYFEDIQRRFYSSTIIAIAFFAIGVLSSGFVIKNIVSLLNFDNVIIATTSPLQFADLAINIGIFCALIVIFPLFIYHLFSFASSALSKKEIRAFILNIPVSVFLFALGFGYGFFILFYSFELLANVNENLGIKNIWDISTFLSQIIITSSLLGFLFQFPLVISLLVKLKVLSAAWLRTKRRLVILSLFILTSLLPPTDGLSLVAMASPLYILFELTILINHKS